MYLYCNCDLVLGTLLYFYYNYWLFGCVKNSIAVSVVFNFIILVTVCVWISSFTIFVCLSWKWKKKFRSDWWRGEWGGRGNVTVFCEVLDLCLCVNHLRSHVRLVFLEGNVNWNCGCFSVAFGCEGNSKRASFRILPFRICGFQEKADGICSVPCPSWSPFLFSVQILLKLWNDELALLDGAHWFGYAHNFIIHSHPIMLIVNRQLLTV